MVLAGTSCRHGTVLTGTTDDAGRIASGCVIELVANHVAACKMFIVAEWPLTAAMSRFKLCGRSEAFTSFRCSSSSLRRSASTCSMIVAARQRPAVVVVGSLADGSADGAPRMYGLADAGQPPRALISDVTSPASQPAFGPLHHFSLMSPFRAGRVLALWATAPGKSGFLSRKKDQTKIIDLYHNRPGEQLTRDRLTVLPGESGQFQVSRQSPGTEPTMPVTHDLDQLADLLTAMLTGAAG